MHHIILTFDKSQPIYMENISNYGICRINNVSVCPCKKISRTSLFVGWGRDGLDMVKGEGEVEERTC